MRIVSHFQFIFAVLLFTKLMTAPANALEFDIVSNGGNCNDCNWIVATGQLESGDVERFEKVLKQEYYTVNPHRTGNIIMFDSPGGSLSAGINLGKKIRELGFAVGIGKTTPTPNTSWFELSPGNCISACAYAFLGGKYRYFGEEEGSCLGFHQFYDKSAVSRNDVLSTQETTQLISGIVVEYLIEIGISLDVYTFASKFTGQEYGCLNKNKELRQLVKNSDIKYTQASLFPFGKGLVAEIQSVQDKRSMRFYCTKGGNATAVFFIPMADAEGLDSYLKSIMDRHNGTQFIAYNESSNKQIFTNISLELIQAIDRGNKTAFVFNIDSSFIQDAFETGNIALYKEISGRAEQGRLASFDFVVKGNSKIPRLLLKNCIN